MGPYKTENLLFNVLLNLTTKSKSELIFVIVCKYHNVSLLFWSFIIIGRNLTHKGIRY